MDILVSWLQVKYDKSFSIVVASLVKFGGLYYCGCSFFPFSERFDCPVKIIVLC